MKSNINRSALQNNNTQMKKKRHLEGKNSNATDFLK